MFLESWSDYSPEDDYEDSYMETPIDYMEVRQSLSHFSKCPTPKRDKTRDRPNVRKSFDSP